jgi:hypothetical protein
MAEHAGDLLLAEAQFNGSSGFRASDLSALRGRFAQLRARMVRDA